MLPTELNEASQHWNRLHHKQALTAEKCNYTLIQAEVAILHADNPGIQVCNWSCQEDCSDEQEPTLFL